jgi:hypothetical protein
VPPPAATNPATHARGRTFRSRRGSDRPWCTCTVDTSCHSATVSWPSRRPRLIRRHAALSARNSSALFAEPGRARTLGPLGTLAQPASSNPATIVSAQRVIAIILRAELSAPTAVDTTARSGSRPVHSDSSPLEASRCTPAALRRSRAQARRCRDRRASTPSMDPSTDPKRMMARPR